MIRIFLFIYISAIIIIINTFKYVLLKPRKEEKAIPLKLYVNLEVDMKFKLCSFFSLCFVTVLIYLFIVVTRCFSWISLLCFVISFFCLLLVFAFSFEVIQSVQVAFINVKLFQLICIILIRNEKFLIKCVYVYENETFEFQLKFHKAILNII